MSVGPLGWTRVTCSVRHGVLTIGELSVNLKKAHVRLEEVAELVLSTVFHLTLVFP